MVYRLEPSLGFVFTCARKLRGAPRLTDVWHKPGLFRPADLHSLKRKELETLAREAGIKRKELGVSKEDLIHMLIKLPVQPEPEGPGPQVLEEYRARLTAVYQAKKPDKLGDVDGLLAKNAEDV